MTFTNNEAGRRVASCPASRREPTPDPASGDSASSGGCGGMYHVVTALLGDPTGDVVV